jgi:hypothetical protein
MDLMANAFLPNGSQDLQRTYNGGSSQSAVPAFTSAASFNLGLITTYAGIPLSYAKFGGGALNELTAGETNVKTTFVGLYNSIANFLALALLSR